MDFAPGGSSPLPNEPTATINREAVVHLTFYFICVIVFIGLTIITVKNIYNMIATQKIRDNVLKTIAQIFILIILLIVIATSEINEKNVLLTAIEHFGYFMEDLIAVYD